MAATQIGKIAVTTGGEWSADAAYAPITIVETDGGKAAYISRKAVPAGTELTNTEYWEKLVTAPTTDATLTQAGEAAEAAATGEAIGAISEDVERLYVTENVSLESFGVTVQRVSANRVKIFGTATDTRRVCVFNGTAAFKTSGGEFAQTLPAGKYKASISFPNERRNNEIECTYSTFASANVFRVADGASCTFTAPVMIGLLIYSGDNYGTAENPTYADVSLTQVTACDVVARRTDATLTEGSMAADAAAVGAALAGKMDRYTAQSIAIAAASWSNNTVTVNVTGVTASNLIQLSCPTKTDMDRYCEADVFCSAQGNGTLTFTCAHTPTAAISINAVIWG